MIEHAIYYQQWLGYITVICFKLIQESTVSAHISFINGLLWCFLICSVDSKWHFRLLDAAEKVRWESYNPVALSFAVSNLIDVKSMSTDH